VQYAKRRFSTQLVAPTTAPFKQPLAVLRAILPVTMASLAQRQVALLAVTKRTNGHECRTIRLLEAGRASSGTLSRNGV